jgi:hypothetical protein
MTFESSAPRLRLACLAQAPHWKMNRHGAEPGCYPVRAPLRVWCSTHPSSAPPRRFVRRGASHDRASSSVVRASARRAEGRWFDPTLAHRRARPRKLIAWTLAGMHGTGRQACLKSRCTSECVGVRVPLPARISRANGPGFQSTRGVIGNRPRLRPGWPREGWGFESPRVDRRARGGAARFFHSSIFAPPLRGSTCAGAHTGL